MEGRPGAEGAGGMAQGVSELSTLNHSANAPMLAVNRKLGYMPLQGIYRVVKTYAED